MNVHDSSEHELKAGRRSLWIDKNEAFLPRVIEYRYVSRDSPETLGVYAALRELVRAGKACSKVFVGRELSPRFDAFPLHSRQVICICQGTTSERAIAMR